VDPLDIPSEVQVKASLPAGRPSLLGPGRLEDVTLNPFRSGHRIQELAFELSRDLLREYCRARASDVPPHALIQAIQPDASAGEAPEVPRYEANRGPGSTADVDFWTTREVREVVKSHVNYVVADTAKWEQSAAFHLDRHPRVEAFVKNAGLGLAIPYLHSGQPHDYQPDGPAAGRRTVDAGSRDEGLQSPG
jgi:type III restriction enzyme